VGGSSEAARPWEVVGTREISDAERAAILRISPHVTPAPVGLAEDLTWPGLAGEQPMPTKNDAPSVQGMVRDDLVVREQIGRERYGTPLQPHNGRDALRDAYEEALDLACYLRQAIAERVHETRDAPSGLRPAPSAEPDEQCSAETRSWDHYTPEQSDSYWIRCTLWGAHGMHKDEHTGLTWVDKAER
jgi:hypothetical protein